MTVGYAYYLGRGLRVGMLTRIGLQDIADPAYHQRATQTPNTQFRLLLEYDLIHF
jgi:hypothetical protein